MPVNPGNLTHLFTGLMAINPKALNALNQQIISFYADGGIPKAAGMQDGDSIDVVPAPGDPDDGPDDGTERVGNVAIVHVDGVLTKNCSLWSALLGGASTSDLCETLDGLGTDPSVGQVVLSIDSPGGEVAGTQEAGAAILRLIAAGKPVHGFVSDQADSAGYWLASQCNTITCGPTASVGCIGVFRAMYDTSAFYANAGVKAVLIATGAYKGVGVDGVAITPDQIAQQQVEVDAVCNVFKATVAAGRKMSPAAVDKVSDGRSFIGQQAVDAGLVDAVGNLDDLVAKLTTPAPGTVTTVTTTTTTMPANTPTPAATAVTETLTMTAPATPAPVTPTATTSATVAPATPPVVAPAITTATATLVPAAPVAADPIEPDADKLARLAALQRTFATDPAFALEMFTLGWDVAKAKAIHTERLAAATPKSVATPPATPAPIGAKSLAFVPSSSDDSRNIAFKGGDAATNAKQQWASNPDIRKKFMSEASYVAYCKYQSRQNQSV